MIFNQGANIIGIKKDINYVMTCAWAMQLDEGELALLLGSQSITANNINVNDIVGINPLMKGQEDIAVALGEGHSDELDKLKDVNYHLDETAILIDGAKNNIKARVIDILDPLDNGDKMIICRVISMVENEGEFLNYQDIKY